MRINVTDIPQFQQPVVGNVYPINGGYGRKAGHAMVLIAITEKRSCLMLVIDKDGEPVGVTAYGVSSMGERAPIAFVRGLEDLTFEMEPLS